MVPKIADTTVLNWLADKLALLPHSRETPVPTREIEALVLERVATVNRGTNALEAVQRLQRVSRGLVAADPLDARIQRWRSLEAKGLLMEGSESDALNALSGASSLYVDLPSERRRKEGVWIERPTGC